MNIQDIEVAVSLITTVIGVIITIITLAIKLHKALKEKNQEAVINFFTNAAQELVILAEDLKNFTGKDKKEWVMTKLNQLAIEAGVKWNKELADGIIEELVHISKNVNKRDKDEYTELE